MKHIAKKKIVGAVSLALLSLAGSHAQAAAPTTEELLKQLQTLQATVSALQKQVQSQSESLAKTQEAIPEGAKIATSDDITGLQSQLEDTKFNVARDRERTTAKTTRDLTIGGTIKGVYNYSTAPTTATSNSPTGSAATDSFSASATLSFSGNLYKDYAEGRNLDFKLGLSYGNPKFGSTTSASSTPAQGDSVTKLTDAYITYKLLPDTGALEEPKLSLTAGQQKIPFGLEAQVSDELRPTVASAQFLTGLPNLNNYQIGLILKGDYAPSADYGFNYRAPLLEYSLGVINGNGANTSDDNSAKDYVGRLAFIVPTDYNSWLRELKIGTSFYEGRKNLNSTTSPYPLLLDHGRTSRRGFDLSYNHNPIGVTFEWVEGSDDTLSTPTSTTSKNTKEVDSRGKVLTVFYNFGDIAQWSKALNNVGKFDDFWPTTSQIYYRYDSFDPNRDTPSDVTLKQTIGYNIFFAQTTKFQVGLTRTHFDPGLKKVNVTDLTAQFQYGF